MKSLMQIFKMEEIPIDQRIEAIKKMANSLCDKYVSNTPNELARELIKILKTQKEQPLKKLRYKKQNDGTPIHDIFEGFCYRGDYPCSPNCTAFRWLNKEKTKAKLYCLDMVVEVEELKE